MSVSDVPWLLAAVFLVAFGGALFWWGLTQLAAGGEDALAVGFYVLALVAGAVSLAVGLLGLALYVNRDKR